MDANIVESIRKGENERVIMKMYEGVYGGHRYLWKNVFRTRLCCSAVSFDHKDLLRYLLETGYDVNYNFGRPEFGYRTPSPLNLAVHLGREDCIKILLNAGARVDMENRFSAEDVTEFVSALELAVIMDRTDLVKLMIPMYDRTRTRIQRTPLHLACLHGARQCLDYILSTEEGQNDVNALDAYDPRHPKRHPSTVSGQYHANVVDANDSRCPEGCSPLMLSLHQGAWLVQRILQAGGNAKHVTKQFKYTVLHIACSSDLYTPCRSVGLYDFSYPPYLPNKSYCAKGFLPPDLPKIIELLIESGCDPDMSSAKGETPLSRLCALVIFDLKVPHAKPFPYDFALYRDVVLSTASILLEHGANPDGNLRYIPLEILVYQLEMILSRFCLIAVNPTLQEIYFPSAFQATILTRDLFRLLLLHCANPNITVSHGYRCSFIVDGLFVVLLNNWSALMDIQSQWIADIVSVIADVFRLLLLFGGKLHEPALVFQMFVQNKHSPEGLLFLTYYLNFCGRPDIELQMKRAPVERQDTYDTRQAELEDFIQRQPILLKQLARIAILRSVGSRALRSVPTLKLPTALTDYILSLK